MVMLYLTTVESTEQQQSELEFIQMQVARIVTGAKRHTSHTLFIYEETGWTTLNERRRLHKRIRMHHIVHKISPKYLTDLLPASRSARVTRQTTRLIPQFSHRTNAFKRSFIPSAIDLWNTGLDDNMRHTQSKAIFRRLIKKAKASGTTHPAVFFPYVFWGGQARHVFF